MNLPQAVIEAGKRSDELIAAHQASLEQANADQGQPPAEQPPQPQAPTRAQPATEETADQMGLATLSDEQTAQQRLRTLQGKYSAEVPRMAQEIRELKQMVQQQAGQLEQQRMSAQPQPPSVPDNVNAANPPAQPTTWTRAKVKQFYDAMATGELLRQGMTAKEIAEIDNDITRAHAEGRIR